MLQFRLKPTTIEISPFCLQISITAAISCFLAEDVVAAALVLPVTLGKFYKYVLLLKYLNHNPTKVPHQVQVAFIT